MSNEPTDRLVSEWETELPEVDVTAMVTMARLHRLSALVRRAVDASFAHAGLSTGEFDVLSALRRSGEPFTLKPSELAEQTMLSPSGMTNRVDRLQAAGLVERTTDPDNRRIAPVRLTEGGREVVERLITEHAAAQADRLAELSDRRRRELDQALRSLLATFDD